MWVLREKSVFAWETSANQSGGIAIDWIVIIVVVLIIGSGGSPQQVLINRKVVIRG